MRDWTPNEERTKARKKQEWIDGIIYSIIWMFGTLIYYLINYI